MLREKIIQQKNIYLPVKNKNVKNTFAKVEYPFLKSIYTSEKKKLSW